MKSGPNKKELQALKKINKASWLIVGIFLFFIGLLAYLFIGSIAIEEHCMKVGREKAKNYSEFLIDPPQDLVEAYKDNPAIISDYSEITPYYVELLRCELGVKKLLPLH